MPYFLPNHVLTAEERKRWGGGHWRPYECHFGRCGCWWWFDGYWYFYDHPMEGAPNIVSDVVYNGQGYPVSAKVPPPTVIYRALNARDARAAVASAEAPPPTVVTPAFPGPLVAIKPAPQPVEQKSADQIEPWPPPIATRSETFNKIDVLRPDLKTVGEFANELHRRLNAAGNYEPRYWGAPNGFALVTRCGAIDERGRSLDIVESRAGLAVSSGFFGGLVGSVTEGARMLLASPFRDSRLFLFVLTDDPGVNDPEATMTEAIANRWFRKGKWTLPEIDRSAKLTSNHLVAVFVYHFRKSERFQYQDRWTDQMTVGRGRSILSLIWVIMSLPLMAIVFFQTITGRYGAWEIGFAWLIPLLLPVLSFIVATWTVAESRKDKILLQNAYVFYASVAFSVFYLALLYVVVARLPRDLVEINDYVANVMRPSSWYLGTLQALVVVAVGKFFLEEIAVNGGPGQPKS